MLQTALDQLNIESRSPHEGETPLELIKKGDFKPQFLLVNIEHPDLEQILTAMKDNYPSTSIILLYPPSEMEELQKIQEKYHIKYYIEGNNINTFALNNLFLKVRSDRAFMQKNQNSNQRYTLIQSLGHGASSNVDLYYDNVLNRKVAIKKIQVEGMREMDADNRINKRIRETRLLFDKLKMKFFLDLTNYTSELVKHDDWDKKNKTKYNIDIRLVNRKKNTKNVLSELLQEYNIYKFKRNSQKRNRRFK